MEKRPGKRCQVVDELANAKEAEVWSEKALETNPDCGLERTKVLVTLRGERLGAGSTAARTELVQKRQRRDEGWQSGRHRSKEPPATFKAANTERVEPATARPWQGVSAGHLAPLLSSLSGSTLGAPSSTWIRAHSFPSSISSPCIGNDILKQ